MVKLANTETAAQKKATRAAYGATLAELAAEGVPVVAVDADLTGSTTTKKLADAGYAGRLFNCGIAEQNMIDVAAGLSLAGNIAFTGSFAVFGTGRAYDQIRNTVCYSNLNVKIAPTHAGISVGPDGGSHQMLEDVSLMRGLPGMRVLVPADYAAARAALRLAAATPGPVYVRMGRAARALRLRRRGGAGNRSRLRAARGERCHHRGQRRGDPRGARRRRRAGRRRHLRRGHRRILGEAARWGDHSRIGGEDRCVVTAEEHSVIGGLGSAVCELLAGADPCAWNAWPCATVSASPASSRNCSAISTLTLRAIVEAVKKVRERAGLC